MCYEKALEVYWCMNLRSNRYKYATCYRSFEISMFLFQKGYRHRLLCSSWNMCTLLKIHLEWYLLTFLKIDVHWSVWLCLIWHSSQIIWAILLFPTFISKIFDYEVYEPSITTYIEKNVINHSIKVNFLVSFNTLSINMKKVRIFFSLAYLWSHLQIIL